MLTLLLLALAPAADWQSATISDLTAGEAEQVATGYQFTEGPAALPDGTLLFSDVRAKTIFRYDPATGEQPTPWMPESGRNNGIVAAADGSIYGCQGGLHRVSLLQRRDGQVMAMPLASAYDNQPLNMPNDLALDADGGLYFTDPVYGKTEPTQPVLGVYYVDAAGQTTRVIDDLQKPNGVLVSTDGKTLYVADADRATLVAYDIDGPGQLSGQRDLYTADPAADGTHGPDGMTIDADGRIYATYTSVVVLQPDGQLVGRIEIPEKPANCIFGGPESKTLFVTARSSLYRVPMTVAGQPLKESGPMPKAGERKAAAAPFVRSYPVTTQATAEDDAKTNAKTNAEMIDAGPLKLAVPDGWKAVPPANRLRLAQFAVPADGGGTVEAVVSGPFGGSDEQNIARWIGQFAADGREVTTTKGTGRTGEYTLVDITGTYNRSVGPPIMRRTESVPSARMLAVILPNPDGQGNYFLKLADTAASVDAQAEAFRKVFGGDKSTEKAVE